ncbi:MAG: plasmid mobilization protein [Planctomycetota bacterium]
MTKKKSKMGRPPLKAKDRKTALVTLRIKPSQRKELEQDAKAKGLSLSSYLLECWQKERK